MLKGTYRSPSVCRVTTGMLISPEVTGIQRRPSRRGRLASGAAVRFCAAALSAARSEEHTSELQSQSNLVCRLLLEKKKKKRSAESTHWSSTETPGTRHK